MRFDFFSYRLVKWSVEPFFLFSTFPPKSFLYLGREAGGGEEIERSKEQKDGENERKSRSNRVRNRKRQKGTGRDVRTQKNGDSDTANELAKIETKTGRGTEKLIHVFVTDNKANSAAFRFSTMQT